MSIKELPIAVLGAGAWGTALSLLLMRNGNQARLWSNDPAQVAVMREQRANPEFLPDFALPDKLRIENDLAATLENVHDILIAVPSQAFTSVLQKIKACRENGWRIVWGTKGLDASGRFTP